LLSSLSKHNPVRWVKAKNKFSKKEKYLCVNIAYITGWMIVKGNYDKENMRILADAWAKDEDKLLKCPQCGHRMVIVQVEPIDDDYNEYVPYDTVIECISCDLKVRAESFSILGCVNVFDLKHLTIAGWSPSGSRVLSTYEHVISYDVLKKLKNSGELKEFLIVNKQVIQVIG
jgi:hypothetical protein